MQELVWNLTFFPQTDSDSRAARCVLCIYFAVPAGGGFPNPEEDGGGHELVQSKSFVLLSLPGPYNCDGSFGLADAFVLRYRLDHNSHPRLHPYNFPGESGRLGAYWLHKSLRRRPVCAKLFILH